MDRIAKVPNKFRKFKTPKGHRPLFRQEFNKGFTVSKKGELHFFGQAIGTTEINLTSIQKWALIFTAFGTMGTFVVAIWGNLMKPVVIDPPSIELEVINKEPNSIEMDLTVGLESVSALGKIDLDNRRIQLKCAPIIRQGNSAPYYVCSQQIPN